MSEDWSLAEMEADIKKYGEGIVGEHAQRLLAEVKRLRKLQPQEVITTCELQFYGNDDLVNELMGRETFKGIIAYGKGEVNNVAAGDGGMKLRVSKGMEVRTILGYMRVALDSFRNMWPAAVDKLFGPPHVEDDE